MYKVFTDGSSSKKSKTIGSSYIVYENDNREPLKSFSKGFLDKKVENARNGIAELLGVYYFLYFLCTEDQKTKIINKEEDILIISDSQYVVNELTTWYRNQMMENFYNTKNKEVIISILWMLYILRKEGYKIKFQWIRGHQNDDTFETFGNNSADKLAVICRTEIENLKEDIENYVSELKQIIKDGEILNRLKQNILNI